MAEYDQENIFAKIIDGSAPCFKVFESKSALAFLDASPTVEGHVIYVPKAKGSRTFLDMPSYKAQEFMYDLQKVVAAVKEATGASSMNVWMNIGEDAGQTVFHPHWHIVPRKADDGRPRFPESGERLTEEAAAPLLAKINAALNPPKPLKKATFSKVMAIQPDSKGLNLKVKITGEPVQAEGAKGQSTFWETPAADETGSVTLSLRADQKEKVSKGMVVEIRNAAVKMIQGHIRVGIDKWGKMAEAEGEVEANTSPGKNISATEYELVKQG